jgi:hypothetical protein
VSRDGRVNTARAWTTIQAGLTATNRRELADATYQVIYEDYTALSKIARTTGLDKPTIRMLVEEAADRAWREDWQQYDNRQNGRMGGREPASPETRPTGPQRPSTDVERRRNPNTEPPKAPPPDPDVRGLWWSPDRPA